MKAVLPVIVMSALGLAITLSADACSAPPDDAYSASRLAEVFDSSKVVVVAKVLSVSRSPVSSDPARAQFSEDAWLVVQETLKGPHVVGETIHVRSTRIIGPCGLNMRNDPPWIYQEDKAAPGGTRPASVSDVWLIYANGDQPYDITDGYSSPMNLLGSKQVEVHRERIRIQGAKNGT